MDNLFSVLEHDSLANDILESITEKPGSVIHISGPTGSGKTNLAFAMLEEWKKLGGEVLVTRCDKNHKGSSLKAMTQLTSYKGVSHHLEFGVKEGIKLAEKLAGSYGVVGKVYDQYAKETLDQYVAHSNFQITDIEASVIHNISKTSRNKPFIILFDDAHSIDEQSFQLIKKIRRNYSSYKGLEFFRNARYIFVTTTKKHDQNPVIDAINVEADKSRSVNYFPEARMEGVLRELGFKESLTEKNYQKLYSLTSGHLRLLKEVVTYLNDLNGDVERVVSSESNKELAKVVIRSQLFDEDPSSEQEIAITLNCAATIGKSMSRSELICLTDSVVKDVRTSIKKAQSKLFLNKINNKLEFSHSCIHSYFRDVSLLDKNKLHSKFAKCIRLINPGDYGARAIHLELAGCTNEADDMWILEWLQELRRDSSLSIDIFPYNKLPPEKKAQFQFLANSIRAYHEGDFPKMRGLLEDVDINDSSIVNKERQYLLALSLALLKLSYTRTKSYDIVKSISLSLAEEFELAARLKLLEIYLLSHQGKKTEALEKEEDIVNFIDSNYSNHPIGQYFRHVIFRRCEQLYPEEVAIVKLKEARRYWQGASASLLPKYPQEYYRTTSNLVASLTYTGRSEEAEEISKEVINAEYFHEGLIQRPEYIWNNYVLACFVNKTIKPSECLSRQQEITSTSRAQHDNIISLSNMAIYSAYNHDFVFSHSTLVECWNRVSSIPGYEIFFRYLIGTNLFAISKLSNIECGISVSQIQSLTSEIDPSGQGVESFRLHHLINDTTDSHVHQSIEEWDTEPSKSNDILGPAWTFWGRRLILCGIHSWVDI
ncbi:AAA family ATPase [Vibrio sp. SCSIO 43132]|uniref:AAA family ATPase n=1 Tax=Vibrio sp. SCSIO 43132 TaxID=2779363 RepID=UPI001CA924FE|nr:AAA family ATPase [Vibrio sp. SCSIO 43132]UAB71151.1 AAA family ATPase [Vibrio sp. SCSIO 43132]